MFKNYSLCEPRVISTIQLIVLPLYIFHYHYYFWFFFSVPIMLMMVFGPYERRSSTTANVR